MSELIAVSGMTATVDQSTVNPPAFPVVAIVIADPPSGAKCSATGLVYRDGDTIQVSAITVPGAGATIPDPGPYQPAMNATSTKVKGEGVSVLREGDLSDTVSATPKIPPAPGTDYPVTFKCKISAAGQAKAKAN